MRKKILSMAMVVVLGLLAGCGKTADSAQTSESKNTAGLEISDSASGTKGAGADNEALETVKVAYMPNYASLWAVVTADKKGYFKEEGLDVEMFMFQDGPTEITAMESGSIDVAYIGSGAHTLAIRGNVDIFSFQHLGNADCVIGLKSHGVNSLEDLKGKKIGYASGTSSEIILMRALASAGLTMKDIEGYDMDVSNMPSAMISGSLDACAPWSPNSTTITKEMGEDAHVLCTNVTFSDESADCTSWVCVPSYAETHREILVKFTRALFKAMDYASKEENYDEVAGYVAEECGTDKDSALAQLSDGAWLDSETFLKYVNDGTVEGYYQTQKENFFAAGTITKEENETPVSEYVLTDIMKQAGESK